MAHADQPAETQPPPAPIPGNDLPGPWPVGEYAAALRQQLRGFARVQLFGELADLQVRRARVYFELRDGRGALPCSIWRDDWDALGLTATVLTDGARVVVAGGCDFYPGSATASPSFTFAVADLRIAGEGDLLAQIARLRRQLTAEGLTERQRALARPSLPRTIGVVCAERSKARDDVLAALRRRGWAGTLVWAFAPVQDRHAAPRITAALRDLAALEQIEVIVVARGGGSLVDLLAFCDETLCRTVALLRTPVIASVGHHSDRTLLDDVAAVSASTPTHAAEAAVPIDVGDAFLRMHAAAGALQRSGRLAVVARARTLVGLARAPAEHVARHRRRLHQELRELRASARRRLASERGLRARELLVIGRKRDVAGGAVVRLGGAGGQTSRDADRLARAGAAALTRRERDLARLRAALLAHEPQRTLERGYALVSDRAGEPLTNAADAREAGGLTVRFADSAVDAEVVSE
jgi:exodeoxyribonuclease VII large subunit